MCRANADDHEFSFWPRRMSLYVPRTHFGRSNSMSVQSSAGKTIAVSAWRTPLVIITCGCLIGAIGFGPRAALGLFLTPMSSAYSWGRDVFALALAIQVLIWGTATPFAGAIADRFGSLLVLSVGSVLYFAGLVLMSYSTTPGMLDFSAGILTG